jgi:hypothetical protein
MAWVVKTESAAEFSVSTTISVDETSSVIAFSECFSSATCDALFRLFIMKKAKRAQIIIKTIESIKVKNILKFLFRQKYYMRKLVDGGAPLKAGRQSLKQ